MTLIYVLIARDQSKVLCDYTDHSGTFEQMANKLVLKTLDNHRATFAYGDDYFFHYINTDSITFMCLREKLYPEKAAFSFLEDIRDKFFKVYSEIEYKTAITHGLNAKFRDTLKNRMEYYRKNYDEEDKLSLLKQTLNDQKNEILRTDDVLSVRSEKIALIVNKAENIKTESKSYYSWVIISFLFIKSKKVRLHSRWRKIKVALIILLILLIIGFFIAIMACGIDFSKC